MQDQTSAEYLQSVQPRLFMICREFEVGRIKLTPYISKVERGWGEVISEGYDPDHSPLGCPVFGVSSNEVTSRSIAAPFRQRAIKS